MRLSVLRGEPAKTHAQLLTHFQELILWAQFLDLLISRKALFL